MEGSSDKMKNEASLIILGLLALTGFVESEYLIPINVSNTPEVSWNPAIAINRLNGHLFIVWNDASNGEDEIFFSKSTDNGVTWSTPVDISFTEGASYSPDIAVDSSGNMHVVWYDNSSGNWEILYTRSDDEGSIWTIPKNISNNTGASKKPSIIADKLNHLHIVWQDETTGNSEIFYTQSLDGGVTWSTKKDISNNGGASRNAVIASDNLNNLHVAWDDDSLGNSEILYSKSINNGASWTTAKDISNNGQYSYKPSIAVDSNNNIYLSWMDNTPGNWEILVTRSSDNGANWTTVKDVSNTPGDSLNPFISIDSTNTIHLLWQDNYQTSGYNDLFYSKTANALNWTVPVNLLNNSGDSLALDVITDTSDNLHITFDDNTPGNWEIFYAKYTGELGSECTLIGDYPPCGQVTVTEILNLIVQWSHNQATVPEVLALITAWAQGG